VSVDGARRDYGVVITGTVADMDLALDLPATETLRAEMRAAREADGTGPGSSGNGSSGNGARAEGASGNGTLAEGS
jgi:hypothetical protein